MSVDPLGRDGAAGYYLEVVVGGVEDYYLRPGESPGRWIGPAAADLGLVAEVRPEDLEALLAGRDSRTGTRIATWLTRPGYDLTLSAPKSVFLLWALGDERVAATVQEAHDQAVDAAIAYLNASACVVGRGRGGRVRSAGNGLIASAFRHRTSREADPQLHTHVLAANLTRGADNEWSSLCSGRSCSGTHGRPGAPTKRSCAAIWPSASACGSVQSRRDTRRLPASTSRRGAPSAGDVWPSNERWPITDAARGGARRWRPSTRARASPSP